jgi:hypothetical protein
LWRWAAGLANHKRGLHNNLFFGNGFPIDNVHEHLGNHCAQFMGRLVYGCEWWVSVLGQHNVVEARNADITPYDEASFLSRAHRA